jgi:putative flippase GtrA
VRKLSRYTLVSAIGMAIQLVVGSIVSALGGHYVIASAVGIGAAALNNFFWHSRWTFRQPTG